MYSAPSMNAFKSKSGWGRGGGGVKTKRRYMAKNSIFRSVGFANWFVRQIFKFAVLKMNWSMKTL